VNLKPASVVASLVLVAAAGAALAWFFRDSPAVRGLAQQTREAASQVGAPGATGTAAGLHKCVQGSQVLYTDAACPAGTRPLAITGGAVSVLPGTPAAAPAASRPNMRDLLAPKEEQSLRDKMMERTIDNIGK
jgi:hypothetical protein